MPQRNNSKEEGLILVHAFRGLGWEQSLMVAGQSKLLTPVHQSGNMICSLTEQTYTTRLVTLSKNMTLFALTVIFAISAPLWKSFSYLLLNWTKWSHMCKRTLQTEFLHKYQSGLERCWWSDRRKLGELTDAHGQTWNQWKVSPFLGPESVFHWSVGKADDLTAFQIYKSY